MTTDEAREALSLLDSRIESVRLSCVYAINDYERALKLRSEGKYSDEDVENDRIRADFAHDILKDLGYKVESYFFGNAITKAVD